MVLTGAGRLRAGHRAVSCRRLAGGGGTGVGGGVAGRGSLPSRPPRGELPAAGRRLGASFHCFISHVNVSDLMLGYEAVNDVIIRHDFHAV